MSDWGKIKGGCPVCGGVASWYQYSADCRGNPSSSGVKCETSKCEWSDEQMSAFWSDLSAKKQADWDRLSAND